jgi:glycosyltransferase involved in cell wall biosynthesis
MRAVIAHDFMELYGGAERVTQEVAQAFPGAPVWTILGRTAVARRMTVDDRWHSLLPEDERLLRHYRYLAPALPALVHRRRLPAADVLIASSYAFAHHFRTVNDAPQVCYCHSPLRFAWTMTAEYRERWAAGAVRGRAFDAMTTRLRKADVAAARRVALFVTSSDFVGRQIEEFYERTAVVIGAPINTGTFVPAAERDPPGGPFFLLCGRLVEPYKKVRLAVEAFRRLPGQRLVIAGDGPERERLQADAPDNVEFVGHLADRDLVPLLQQCEALIFPSADDLGLMPLEAMACGRPVLAFDGGGARHTVVEGVTGTFFAEQSADAIVGVVERFRADDYDARRIRAHLLRWDRARFHERLHDSVGLAVPHA